jgi:hypothetical protein
VKIINTSDPAPPSKVSGLYMGEAYTGKTYNICTWPNPLIVSFDPHINTARKFKGVQVIEFTSWSEFDRDLLPHIKNRTLSKLVGSKVDTLAIDTLSVGAQRCSEEIRGASEKMTSPMYGRLLSKLATAVMTCTDATTDRPGSESYNFLVTSHLKTITKGDGADQRVIGVRPAIDGQFRDLLPRLLSFAFVCATRQRVVTAPNQPGRTITEYFVHTASPEGNLYICGDRIGGEGTAYNTLPPTVGGTYQELTAAWGMEVEQVQSS